MSNADPHRRCARFGVSRLSDAELLTIILDAGDPGTSSMMLGAAGSLARLAHLPAAVLTREAGISRTQATRLLAAFEAGRRSLRDDAHRPTVHSADEAFTILIPELGGRPQESLWALYLNQQHCLLAQRCLTTGNDAHTIIDPRQVLQPALQLGAAAVIIAHNHPCGDPQPSSDDIQATRQLCKAASLLGLELIDHIIVGEDCYVSLAEFGILPTRWA